MKQVIKTEKHPIKLWLDFIRPGKPIENAYIESFNGIFRDECLNEQVFSSLQDAKIKIEKWRIDYNNNRPHSGINNLTPKGFFNLSKKINITENTKWELVLQTG